MAAEPVRTYPAGMPDARSPEPRGEEIASAAAEIAVMADTIERHRERVASLATPFLGTQRDDVVTSIQEAERQLLIAARALRRALMDNVLYLRRQAAAAGLEVLGDPSPIVPIHVGAEGVARLATTRLAELGAIANLVEYPAVPKGGARFRVQVMAAHRTADIDKLVVAMRRAVEEAEHAVRSFESSVAMVEAA